MCIISSSFAFFVLLLMLLLIFKIKRSMHCDHRDVLVVGDVGVLITCKNNTLFSRKSKTFLKLLKILAIIEHSRRNWGL